MKPKILAFAGSLRKDSYNKKLAAVAADMARAAGADVTHVDLRDYPMPIYDGDIEAASGIPDIALKFRELMKSHNGFLISAPEYNSSISGVLKNTIDWASRPRDREPKLVCFTGKIVGLLAASPGALGGLRGLFHVRDIFLNINSIVLPTMYAMTGADTAFDSNGQLKDEARRQKVEGVVIALLDAVSKLHGERV